LMVIFGIIFSRNIKTKFYIRLDIWSFSYISLLTNLFIEHCVIYCSSFVTKVIYILHWCLNSFWCNHICNQLILTILLQQYTTKSTLWDQIIIVYYYRFIPCKHHLCSKDIMDRAMGLVCPKPTPLVWTCTI